MNNVVQFTQGGLPADPSSLAQMGTAVAASAGSGGADDLLRLLRDGMWVFGAENVEPEEGSKWAINPYSFQHGYICWGDNSNVLGEVMVPVMQPLPQRSELADMGEDKDGKPFVWQDQLSFQLQCISGEDRGVQVLFKTTSVGGKRATGEMANRISSRAVDGSDELIPVVHLSVDSYQHKQYGKIYTPVFEIVEWIAASDEAPEQEAEPAQQAEAATEPAANADAPKPTGRRRRSR